jgi:hypothetical protein
MAAVIDFGEMLVVSILAIILLMISPLEMGSTAAIFVGGVVSWTLAEYAVHRFVLHDIAPREHGLHHANPDEPVLKIFWKIWVCFALVYYIEAARSLRARSCLCLVLVRASLRASRPQTFAASAARASPKPS